MVTGAICDITAGGLAQYSGPLMVALEFFEFFLYSSPRLYRERSLEFNTKMGGSSSV